MAMGLRGSAILGIAGEVRGLVKEGKQIVDMTVGDFSSKQFRIPRELEDAIVDALRAGESTYPPPIGMESLRQAVRDFYSRRLGLDFPIESVLIASGARPVIYAAYRALIDPGDRVVFGVPSWNNDYYCQLIGAEAVTVDCAPMRPVSYRRQICCGPSLPGANARAELAAESLRNIARRAAARRDLRSRARGESRADPTNDRCICCTTRCTGCSRPAAPSTSTPCRFAPKSRRM